MAGFRTLTQDCVDRWYSAASSLGIPQEAVRPEIKVLSDPSGLSDFTFGVILNEYRFQRPQMPKNCPLCSVVEGVVKDAQKSLDPDSLLSGWAVTPNKFPPVEGHSLAIDKGVEPLERKMYTTQNLDGLADEFGQMVDFANITGYRVFHNSEGAGASIPGHEHWHFTSFGSAYEKVGESYGFDAADLERFDGNGVSHMPKFLFAHAVFKKDEPDRLVSFLKKLGGDLGGRYEDRCVPHTISQGERGVLVVPVKVYGMGGIGSGDVAGHMPVRTRQDFDNANYTSCQQKLSKRLFGKDDINLRRYL